MCSCVFGSKYSTSACYASQKRSTHVQVTKPWAGRLRPDFLYRCQPPTLERAVADASNGQQANLTLGSISVFQQVRAFNLNVCSGFGFS